MNHITVGVYSNNDYVVNVVREEHLENHIEYNKAWRPGRALFVDNECVNKGYLNDEQINYWIDKIKGMNIDTNHPSEKYQ